MPNVTDFQPFLAFTIITYQVTLVSDQQFLRFCADRQTDRHTDAQTDAA